MAKKVLWVGIDVSKDTLDIAFRPTGEQIQLANTEDAITTFVTQLKRRKPTLVLYEPTNHYHDLLASVLVAAKIPVREANPAKARAFAKSVGQEEKTDLLDARMLAHYAETLKEARPLPDAATKELDAHVTRRRQLVEIRKQEQTRRSGTKAAIRTGIDEHLAWLTERIETIDATIAGLIAANSVFAERQALLQTAKGVGPVLSATHIVELPELGRLSRRKIAKLVGVAPLARSSGKYKGKALCWGGRSAIRAVLYQATMAAAQWNVLITPFYDRLRQAGKEHKQAIVACMRKFLTILNAMVRDNVPFSAVKLAAA